MFDKIGTIKLFIDVFCNHGFLKKYLFLNNVLFSFKILLSLVNFMFIYNC